MQQLLLTTCFLLSCLVAAGQTFFVETRQLPIRQYDALEKRLHSARRPDKQVTVLGAEFELGPEQQYARANPHVRPRPLVSYTYSLPDSVVRVIELEIDSLNYLGTTYEATHKYRESPARYPQFLSAYAQIKRELEAQLGKPTTSQPAHKESDNLGESYRQSDNWNTQALTASLDLIFSLTTKSIPGPPNSVVLSVEGSHAYRIRATIRYKNTTTNSAQSATPAANNPRQQVLAEKYMALLLANKYAESWSLLGPDITQSITFDQYKDTFTKFLASVPAPEKGATLFMSGLSAGAGGHTYSMYAFRLNADSTSPPTTLITIVFKDATTEIISGIQPRTRSAGPPSVTK